MVFPPWLLGQDYDVGDRSFWSKAQVTADSLSRIDPEEARSIQASSVALGLARASFSGLADSVKEAKEVLQELSRERPRSL
jgi:hypothetical protein